MSFGKRLRDLRQSKKISQTDLGTKIGVKQSMITKYEHGESMPSIEMMISIAKELDVSIDYLVGASAKKDNFDPDNTDIMRTVNLVRPKINGVEVSDEQWELITLFLKGVVKQLEAEGKLPRKD
jgi:transcriptional regulator with XRE-family HTH domain